MRTKGPRQLTLGHLLAFFHRFEVDGGNGTDHLHRFCFNQTGVLPVPTSPLQVQASDKYSILEREGAVSAMSTCLEVTFSQSGLETERHEEEGNTAGEKTEEGKIGLGSERWSQRQEGAPEKHCEVKWTLIR